MNKSILFLSSSLLLLSAADATIPEAVVKPGFEPINTVTSPGSLGLCESDCDLDTDCAAGLVCADQHKDALKAVGLDSRKANCYNVVKPQFYEVCFDPSILNSGGAGGGTLL
jgi:hypothetical protein